MKWTFTIKVPVYSFNIRVTIADNVEQYINKQCRKLGLEDYEGTVHGLAMEGKDVHDYFLFFDANSVTINTVIHEVSHIIDYAFNHRDIELDGEPRAHLSGHIGEEVIKYMYKKQLLKDKWLKKKQKETNVEVAIVKQCLSLENKP